MLQEKLMETNTEIVVEHGDVPILRDGNSFIDTILVLHQSSLHIISSTSTGTSTLILLLDDILYIAAEENDSKRAQLLITARRHNEKSVNRDRVEIRLTSKEGAENNRDIWAAIISSARIGCVEDSSGHCSEAKWLSSVLAAAKLESTSSSSLSASSNTSISSGSSSSSSSSSSSPRTDVSGVLSSVFSDPHTNVLSPPSLTKKINTTKATTASVKRKRRLLVYVFPASGKGQAESIWMSDVAPIFEDAHIDSDVIVTKRACQSKDELRAIPWSALCLYSGVVAIGGDGALSEVVEGLLCRHDWKRATQKITVGVIPAGSGNGMALSLLSAAHIHPATAQNAAILIARGRCVPLDIASTFVRNQAPSKLVDDSRKTALSDSSQSLNEATGVLKENPVVVVLGGNGIDSRGEGFQTPSASVRSYSSVSTSSSSTRSPASLSSSTTSFGQASSGIWGERRFSFLSLEWAIIADIDIESESLRFLGDARFDVYGALRGISLRKYSGRFSYLPADRADCSGRKARLWWGSDGKKVPGQMTTTVDSGGGGMSSSGDGGGGHRSRTGSMWSVEDHDSSSLLNAATGLNENEGNGVSPTTVTDAPPDLHHLLPFNIPTPLSWRSIEGVFTFLWITNTTHQSAGVAISPQAHYNNGTMTVTLVRDCNPLGMLRVLLSMDEKGSIAHVPGVETFTCSAWRLEPDKRKIGGCFKNRFVAPDGNHIALDGEVVEYGPIQAEVHAGLIRVFG
jgi:diacylglycerol kinase family enzyme